jgi:hypothetical protein
MKNQAHNLESQVQKTNPRHRRKFSTALRKTVSFRIKAVEHLISGQSVLIETIKAESPGAVVLGPFADNRYHIWEPRPAKKGRPPVTKAQRIVRMNPDVFEAM